MRCLRLFLCFACAAFWLVSFTSQAEEEYAEPEEVTFDDLLLNESEKESVAPLIIPDINIKDFNPDEIVAIVNKEEVVAGQVLPHKDGLKNAIAEVLLNQGVEKDVSIYSDEYIERYRRAIRARITQLYLQRNLERNFEEIGLNKQFNKWLEGYKHNLQAQFPITMLLRRDQAEAYALIRWVNRGYDFEETVREYSQLRELIQSSPMSVRIQEHMADLEQQLQAKLKPGEMTQQPLQTPFGWVIAYKSAFERGYSERVAMLRRQFLIRHGEQIARRLFEEAALKANVKRYPLPKTKDGAPDFSEKSRKKIVAVIPARPMEFTLTYGDILDEFYKSALNNMGIPIEAQLNRIYANQVQNLVIYDEARHDINESDPQVSGYMDGIAKQIRRNIFMDKKINEIKGMDKYFKEKYEDVKAIFKPFTIVQVRELATNAVGEMLSLLEKWKTGTPFEEVARFSIFSQDMTDFFVSRYIVLLENDGRTKYADVNDNNRYGSELLRLSEGDFSRNPVFHGGKWGGYKVVNKQRGEIPSFDILRPALVRGAFLDLKNRVVEKLKKEADIQILVDPNA